MSYQIKNVKSFITTSRIVSKATKLPKSKKRWRSRESFRWMKLKCKIKICISCICNNSNSSNSSNSQIRLCIMELMKMEWQMQWMRSSKCWQSSKKQPNSSNSSNSWIINNRLNSINLIRTQPIKTNKCSNKMTHKQILWRVQLKPIKSIWSCVSNFLKA